MATEIRKTFEVRVGFCSRRSWADEEEELRYLEALDCEILVSKDGKVERAKREEVIANHQKFHVESLYQSWATGKNANFVDRIFNPLYSVVRVFNESMYEFEKKAEKIASDMRKKIYRPCRADDRQCLAAFKIHEKAMVSFCGEFQKICATSLKMRMFPKEDPGPVMESLANISKWELMSRFKGLCENPKRTKEANRLREACYDAAFDFYANTAGALMIAEKNVVKTHRELIQYKLEFDRSNPDIVALMKC